MGYYLSKKNKEVLELFIPKLKSEQKDFSISLVNPGRLIHILRQCPGYEEYKWIGEKFIISEKKDRVEFRLKSLIVIGDESSPLESLETIVNDPTDFFEIINYLMSSPINITFKSITITLDELERLAEWCNSNGYTYIYNNPILNIRKK